MTACFPTAITGARKGHSNKGAGWDFVHVAIDDAIRLAYVEVLPDERRGSVTTVPDPDAPLVEGARRAGQAGDDRQWNCYVSKLFGNALRLLKIKHIRTKPYTPRTSGKAERYPNPDA